LATERAKETAMVTVKEMETVKATVQVLPQ
jgi:hypothetical protein